MESARVRVCILNASNGIRWYPIGSHRLKRSLIHHGYAHDLLFFNKWPNNEFDKMCPYNIKAAAFHEALKRNYDIILWADCSVWAINYPYDLIDIINTDGYYFWTANNSIQSKINNCAQTCSDKCLDYFNVDRDTAETYTDVAAALFGIHTRNEIASQFINAWIQSARDGQFSGSREHAGQSSDPRFLFHRQDQSCASIIVNKLGLKIHNEGEHVQLYKKDIPDNIIFTLRGL